MTRSSVSLYYNKFIHQLEKRIDYSSSIKKEVLMSKLCVFCGMKPDKKTKEHVVPKWLIALTGDPKRTAFFGYNKDYKSGLSHRKFSFNSFTFPACLDCNNKYSDLEGKAKPILINIMNEELISTEDFTLFLDWLDKVRIGIWLGMLQLDKDFTNISPSFHIETRISQYDRLVIIEKTDSKSNRLNFGGAETLSFSITPSAFLLVVNNYYFTNISSMFLLHRRLGFPYPREMYFCSDDHRIEMNFVEGRKRIMKPLLRKAIEEKGTILYQPMFCGGLTEGNRSEYYDDYVRSHSLNFEKGIGNLFKEENGDLIELKKGESFSIISSNVQIDEKLYVKSAINILKWQNWLGSLMPKMDHLELEQKRHINSSSQASKEFNDIFIKHYQSML